MATADFSALLDHAVKHGNAYAARKRGEWTPEEDAFIEKNLGWLTDAEMGKALGRSEISIHLRWTRKGLPGPSKNPNVITAQKAAVALGIDTHKVCHWIDMGIIRGRPMAGRRKIRLVRREDFRRWVLDPMNWIYFDPRKIADRELRRMAMLRMQRWGDEWWTTRQVAEYHGVETSDVKRYIQLGRIRARQTTVSLGGRHADMSWASWFVLKSEATRPDLVFVKKGRGAPGMSRSFSARADAWILKARDELGMTFRAIERTMKIDRKKCGSVVSARYYRLKGKQKKQGKKKD